MSDALSIFQQPHPPALSTSDAADLARLRDAERLRTEGRIATLETSITDLTARLDAADEGYAELVDRLAVLEAANTPKPAKGASGKPTGKDGAASDDGAAQQADDDEGAVDDGGKGSGSGGGDGAAPKPARNPLRGEVTRRVEKRVL